MPNPRTICHPVTFCISREVIAHDKPHKACRVFLNHLGKIPRIQSKRAVIQISPVGDRRAYSHRICSVQKRCVPHELQPMGTTREAFVEDLTY
jgi:hypothetical protein